MTGPLDVIVSPQTLARLGSQPEPWLHLRTAAEPGSAEVVWRRQIDRTQWLVEAVAQGNVSWIHTDTAGVDRLPLDAWSAAGLLLTRARGVYSIPVSEWALGAMMLAAKRLDLAVRRSDAGVWGAPGAVGELSGAKVVIFGFGSIGRALASRCQALGMRVVGVTRSARPAVRSEGLMVVSAGQEWRAELRDCEYLVLTAPLTADTRGVINSAVLRALPRRAWLINVSRGELVDERGLLEALDGEHLNGAVLDAFSQEPLPPANPLWRRPNVVVSPHASSVSQAGDRRAYELFLHEAQAFTDRQPPLNPVSYERGY